MKKMKRGVPHSQPICSQKSFPGREELSMEEASRIRGGESLWYWIGYGVGYAGHILSQSPGQQSGVRLTMNSTV